jgi:hypothetical protein
MPFAGVPKLFECRSQLMTEHFSCNFQVMRKIISHFYRIFVTAFCVMAASVHAQTIEQIAKNPRQLKTFTFVPAAAPSVYSFKSSWRAPRDNSSNLPKSQDELNAIRLTQMDLFDDAMQALKPKLEEELNQAFLRHWRDLGFEVKTIENLKRRLRQPDVVNFSSIKTDTDAIVQVFLDLATDQPTILTCM